MKALVRIPAVFLRLVYQSMYLALGQIWANKVRSILTTIGIVIGVASVTSVIASLSGLKAKVLSGVESFGTNSIFISHRQPDSGPMHRAPYWRIRLLPQHFDDTLEHCPSVERFSRVSGGGAETVRHVERSVEGVNVSGIEPPWHKIVYRPILLGRPFSIIDETQGRLVCMIDPKLRDKLRLDRDCIGQTIILLNKTFRIVGVIEQQPERGFGGGGSNYEVYIPFRTDQKLRTPWVYGIAASKSTKVTEEAQAEISFFLRRTRRIKPGEPDTFRVESLKSALKKFNDIARVVTLIAGGIVGISLLVGGVGIMNIMLVSVSERTKEIGLRKAVGAKKSAILTQFLVEAVSLCFVGGLAGIGLGHLLTLLISGLTPALEKAYIPTWAIALSFGFAGFVGVFFGMFPAIKAARLDPIEALRHE
jgi:putative ABC transport system permease protein